MTLIKSRDSKLNDIDLNFIEVIFNSGGYFSQVHMNTLYDNVSNQANWLRLKKLVDLNYLKEHLLDSNMPNEPVIYQVRHSACKLMNNPDSYFRKRHNKSYIRRALIKGLFVVENYIDLYNYTLFDNNIKQQFLLSKGYDISSLPTKSNYNKRTSKNDLMIHVEELLIDMNSVNNKPDFINDDTDILVVYVDKQHPSSIKAQVNILLQNYKLLVEEYKHNISFLIVCDNNKRAELYKTIADIEMDNIFDLSINVPNNKTFNVDNELLKTYVGTIIKYLEYQGKHNDIELLVNSFKSGNLKTDVESKLSINDANYIESSNKELIIKYNNKHISYLQNEIKNYINTHGEEGFNTAISLLKDMIRLNYFGHIYFLSESNVLPSIFTYIVSKRYYTF